MIRLAKVGITCLKLGNQRSTKSKSSRRGDLRSVACEALTERWSKDPDVDRTKTKDNIYTGYHSGLALTEAMTAEAQAYSDKRKAEGGRALRSDAAIGWGLIVKPPLGFFDSMNKSEKDRFWDDTIEILGETVGKSNIRATVIQVDEVEEHMHLFGMGYDEHGKLCVDNVINPRVWSRWNHEYPQRMRERGWQIEDCDPKEQDEQPKHGKSAVRYKLEKDRKRKTELDAQAERQAQKAAEQAQRARQLEDSAKHNLRTRMALKDREKAVETQATEQADLISDGRKYRAMMAAQARRDRVDGLAVNQHTHQSTRDLPHTGFDL